MKQSLYTVSILLLGFLLNPQSALAQRDFKGEVGNITDFLVNLVVPILTSLALLLFFWGLAQYVLQAGDEQAVEDSRQRMLWGIVGLFVITAIWGIISFIGDGFNLL